MDRMELNVSWSTLWKIFIMVAFVAILTMSKEVVVAALLAIVIQIKGQ